MRYITNHVIKDLKKKMVFIGGPRQCGKTTACNEILDIFPYQNGGRGKSFNWDYITDKKNILKMAWSDEDQLVFLDEIHKYSKWKSWLKGIYDVQKKERVFLVSGSARLDLYKRGGDSLLGRYHYWRMHPFTLDEIPKGISSKDALKRLMSVGGFPEPFLDNDPREAKRWRRERIQKIIKDDVRDLENVQDIGTLELFVEALRERVGGEVVLSNIAEDLNNSPKTLKSWLGILEKMYLCFAVYPYTHKISRAILKTPKIFFYDNCDLSNQDDEGAIFENLVATHLLKKIQFLEDSQGDSYQLRYIRDKEKREVDFVIVKNGKVEALYEAKVSDERPSKSLIYYAERLKPKFAYQIVLNAKQKETRGRYVMGSPFDILGSPSYFD